MLSFDITDRNIRVIKGTETGGGKIRIQSSTDIRIEEGLIVNGYIKDIAQMATIINTGLKQRSIKDKDAVISISSNLIVFRELYIPKGKASQFKTAVQMEMQKNVTVTDEQAIAYTIVGDVEKDGKTMSKVLANAVPKNVVECYRRVFSMLNIALKSVSVSCNCISRVVLSDPQVTARMPMLLVQIDPNFININVFENGQLSFSRFASISPDDYDDKTDYVFQAVNENLFRMFQFQRSRSGENIQNVVFYGDTSEFIRLTNSLEQMDVKASLLKVPPMLSGYENLEFSLYANAIGAMYKRPKDDESSNLLTTDTSAASDSNASKEKVDVSATQVLGNIGVGFLLGAIVVAGAWAVLDPVLCGIAKGQINAIDSYIAEKQPDLDKIDKGQSIFDKLNTFNSKVATAEKAVSSYPMFTSEVYGQILTCSEGAKLRQIELMDDGTVTVTYVGDSITIPSIVASNYVKNDFFDNVTYNEYSEEKEKANAGSLAEGGALGETTTYDPITGQMVVVPVVKSENSVTFDISFQLRGPLQNEEIKNPTVAEDTTEGGAE